MKQLTVRLNYGSMDTNGRRGSDGGLLLPVKALDEEGSVLAEGAAGIERPAVLSLPDAATQAFVRLTWPSGRTQTRRVGLADRPAAEIDFSDASIAPNGWSAWAIPRLNPRTPLAAGRGDVDLDLQRFDQVWLRLWRHNGTDWQQERLQPDATYRNGAAWQLDLTLDQAAWLLQLGGSQVPWRFISLPGGGPARVLFTPKDSDDPRGDPIKVVVTSFRADAETLLEFLARDAMRAADTLAESQSLAKQLFADKFDDPVSAVAGAYHLLRRGDWERIPHLWFENLSNQFGWLPDASIAHCVRLLREGSDASHSRESPLQLFVQSLQQGWPVYREGALLLQEAASALRKDLERSHSNLLTVVQGLGAATSWAGAAATFYGRQPNIPSALQWVGMPRAPRRRRLDPALKAPARVDLPDELLLLGAAEVSSAARSTRRVTGEVERSRKPRPAAAPIEEFLLGSIGG
jgi:hypothetical protein